MALVGKTFPDMSVKAIDEMGDAFQINVLKQAVRQQKESMPFLVSKGFHFCLSNRNSRVSRSCEGV